MEKGAAEKQCQLIIKAKPRIHITLIGMDADGYRVNGGVGFCIEEPVVRLKFSCADDFEVVDHRVSALTVSEIGRIYSIIERERINFKFNNDIRIEIDGEMLTHYGLGSGTAIRLACLEALHILNGSMPPTDVLVAASGRGGTSGIGINTYFTGGFIVDLGRRADQQIHQPSHLSEDRLKLPLLMQRLDMPDWNIGLCIPTNCSPKSEEEEADFFRKTCPIPPDEVYRTLYHGIYGLYAAVRERDLEAFNLAIRTIQECAWKLAERKEHGSNLLELEKQLYHCGALSVGMSSLGPTLFFLGENILEIIRKMKGLASNCIFLSTKPANAGRTLIYA